MNEEELHAFRFLNKIAETDIELANTTASFPWLTDNVTEDEWEAIWGLSLIASENLDLARTATTLSWLVDGVTSVEKSTLSALNKIASEDLDLARTAINLPWVIDGITDEDGSTFWSLALVASTDIQLANTVLTLPWMDRQWERDLNRYLLHSLDSIPARGADALSELTAQPWFADGLNEEEAALVATLHPIDDVALYRNLLEAHHTQSGTVSLPLAGEVNIWVFQNTPFPQNDNLLTVIEDTARMSEGLLGVPFPTTDIILLVVDSSETWYSVYPGHYGSHMQLTRDSGMVFYVPHETAHYYFFNPETGPRWLTEGAAEFIETYFNDRMGIQGLASKRANVSFEAQSCVDIGGVENIRHLYHVLESDWVPSRPAGCIYQMGENFLHRATQLAGEDSVMSALGDLHVSELGKERGSVEDRIYEVFLNHIPPELKEDFRQLYRELHGGAAAFEESDLSDDHGDEAKDATEIEVREMVPGSLDYMWDFDFFRFSAQAGQKYIIAVNHESLLSSSVGLYGPDGLRGENKSWISRELRQDGPRIVWTAPTSEDFYAAVHNFGGKAGAYTLTITPVETSALDKHRDNAALATEIPVGTVVEATINDDLDIDFFSIQEELEKKYQLVIEGGTLEEFNFRVVFSDGRFWKFDSTRRDFSWTAGTSDIVTIAIQSLNSSIGTYTLMITAVNN